MPEARKSLFQSCCDWCPIHICTSSIYLIDVEPSFNPLPHAVPTRGEGSQISTHFVCTEDRTRSEPRDLETGLRAALQIPAGRAVTMFDEFTEIGLINACTLGV